MHLSTAEFEELERRVAERDRAAFEALHRAYQNLVSHFVVSKISDSPLAREITAQIFETAWETCDRYPWRDFSFHVWLLRIARGELEERGLIGQEGRWLGRVLEQGGP